MKKTIENIKKNYEKFTQNFRAKMARNVNFYNLQNNKKFRFDESSLDILDE